MKPIVFSSIETTIPERIPVPRVALGVIVGLLIMSVAILLLWQIGPLVQNQVRLSALCWAVAVTVWFFGWGPALISAVFGFLTAMAFFSPPGAESRSEQFSFTSVVYATNCIAIIVLGECARFAMARRERTQQNLEARVNDLQTLLDILPCGVWITDPTGKTVTGNKQAYALLGRSEPEPTAPEDDRACNEFQYFEKGVPIPYEDMPLQKVARSGEPLMGFEYEIIFPDMHSRFIFGNAAPLKDAHGIMRGVIAAAVDFTERKRVELELAQHRNHLREKVRKRTASLIKSEKLLEKSERLASLGIFASGIAHELNNPLNSILLMTQYLLRKRNELNLSVETLQKIKDEAKRGGEIVKNILRLARDEHSPKKETQMGEVIRHAVSLVKTYVDCSRLDIDLQIHPDLPPVMMDALEIEQVLMNLIKNAVEASSDSVHVGIDARFEDHTVVLHVSNDGPEIPRHVCEHLFDPFFSTKRAMGGSGLGLSLVHKIITEHQGSIDVKSSATRGTTFTIRLPVNGPDLEIMRPEHN